MQWASSSARLSASRRNRAGEILIATDSSVKTLGEQRRAAWGIAFDGCSSAFATHGCDQHIYTAEAWALFQALLMVEQAAAPAIVLCGCKNVVQTARRVRRGGRLPLWSVALWKMIANIAPACRILWVPAHDRRPDWKPPDGHSAVECRELNRLADHAAVVRCTQHLAQLRDWACEKGRAAQWSNQALVWQHKVLCEFANEVQRRLPEGQSDS